MRCPVLPGDAARRARLARLRCRAWVPRLVRPAGSRRPGRPPCHGRTARRALPGFRRRSARRRPAIGDLVALRLGRCAALPRPPGRILRRRAGRGGAASAAPVRPLSGVALGCAGPGSRAGVRLRLRPVRLGCGRPVSAPAVGRSAPPGRPIGLPSRPRGPGPRKCRRPPARARPLPARARCRPGPHQAGARRLGRQRQTSPLPPLHAAPRQHPAWHPHRRLGVCPAHRRVVLHARHGWRVGMARDKNTGPLGSVRKQTRCA